MGLSLDTVPQGWPRQLTAPVLQMRTEFCRPTGLPACAIQVTEDMRPGHDPPGQGLGCLREGLSHEAVHALQALHLDLSHVHDVRQALASAALVRVSFASQDGRERAKR